MQLPTDRIKTSLSVTERLAQRARERAQNPGAIWGRMPWCFEGLNRLTGGIQDSEMTVLQSRPSVGKTTIMVQQTEHTAQYLRKPDEWREGDDWTDHVIKLVLCESTADVFQGRWASLRAGVSLRKIKEGTATGEQLERYLQALKELAKEPIEYLDNPRTLDEIVAFLSTGRPTFWWALDHLHKCPLSPTRPNDGSVGVLTLISAGLSHVCELSAPGMVLAHCKREVDSREDKRPQMGDIKGASSVEGDARVVLGLYREDIYVKTAEEERNKARPAELIVNKQNEGDTNRTVDLLWFPGRWFKDVSNLYVGEEEE